VYGVVLYPAQLVVSHTRFVIISCVWHDTVRVFCRFVLCIVLFRLLGVKLALT
jgi:hypothetical protein